MTNGDNLTSLRLDDLVSLHFARNAVATMMLTPFQSQYGVVEVGESDMVTSFVEKGRLPLWINAGDLRVRPRDRGPVPEVGDHETTTFPMLAAQERLAALRSEATWFTIDSQKELREVSDRLRAGSLEKAD